MNAVESQLFWITTPKPLLYLRFYVFKDFILNKQSSLGLKRPTCAHTHSRIPPQAQSWELTVDTVGLELEIYGF